MKSSRCWHCLNFCINRHVQLDMFQNRTFGSHPTKLPASHSPIFTISANDPTVLSKPQWKGHNGFLFSRTLCISSTKPVPSTLLPKWNAHPAPALCCTSVPWSAFLLFSLLPLARNSPRLGSSQGDTPKAYIWWSHSRIPTGSTTVHGTQTGTQAFAKDNETSFAWVPLFVQLFHLLIILQPCGSAFRCSQPCVCCQV